MLSPPENELLEGRGLSITSRLLEPTKGPVSTGRGMGGCFSHVVQVVAVETGAGEGDWLTAYTCVHLKLIEDVNLK